MLPLSKLGAEWAKTSLGCSFNEQTTYNRCRQRTTDYVRHYFNMPGSNRLIFWGGRSNASSLLFVYISYSPYGLLLHNRLKDYLCWNSRRDLHCFVTSCSIETLNRRVMSPFINIQRYAAHFLIFIDMQIRSRPSWICKLAISIAMQIRPRAHLMNMQTKLDPRPVTRELPTMPVTFDPWPLTSTGSSLYMLNTTFTTKLPTQ